MDKTYMEITKNSSGRYVAGFGKSIGYRGAETPVTPDGPDDSTLVMLWKRLGPLVWRRVVECVGLIRSFLRWQPN
jgi:hypothetical protein